MDQETFWNGEMAASQRNYIPTTSTPLVCFSHLRWNFVYQRPQHLMCRASSVRDVVYWEEPVYGELSAPRLMLTRVDGITVAVPELPRASEGEAANTAQRALLDSYLAGLDLQNTTFWYYTPMALSFSGHLNPGLVVYDCMDELSLFRGAPPALVEMEKQLLARADRVFTGGRSLYEAKRHLHPSVHALPSGVDVRHFASARPAEPAARRFAEPSRPKLGFAGVIDERMDLELLDELAAARPNWQIVMIGPVVKIDPATLPRRPNIEWLGQQPYTELPRYFAGWDIGLLPFALNESTRFISPTKTPEYLAAGLPVISTPIADVMHTYGESGLVAIADNADSFVALAEAYLCEPRANRLRRQAEADTLLAEMSWDRRWEQVAALLKCPRSPAERTLGAAHRAIAADHARPGRAGSPPHNVAKGPGWRFDYLIVGAGFAGSILAERLARQADKRILLIDKRPHIGGNAYDTYDDAGILVHRYGPHIFHTNSAEVFAYLSQFTKWRPYEHRVLARVQGGLVPIPINRTTINKLYGLNLAEEQVEAFLAGRAEPVERITTSEDVVVARVGRELYELFFRGYTRKQWGLDPSALDKSVTARVPVRTNDDDRYFADKFQAMPAQGYTRMFERMLDHPNIKVLLNTDYREVMDDILAEEIIFTGPIDEFFDYQYGALPYRSLRFQHVTYDTERFQPVAVVNYPAEGIPYTRVTEYKHLTGQSHGRTSVCYEFPTAAGDPYYPIPKPENASLYRRYQQLADATPGVHFVGRLATYRYYNMDQVAAQALALFDKLIGAKRKTVFAANSAQGAGERQVAAS